MLDDVEKGTVSKEVLLQLISECVGKQISTNPTKANRLIDYLFTKGHTDLKYVGACSLRHLKEGVLNDDMYIRPKILQLCKMSG